MDTVAHYFVVISPILWWALFFAGVAAYVRDKGLVQLCISLGAFAYAAMATVSALFPASRILDGEGNVVRITEPLLPWQLSVSLSFIGLMLVIGGVSVLLLKRAR